MNTQTPLPIDWLKAILANLLHSKTRLALKTLHKVISKLCSMSIAIPGLWGLFSLLQKAIGHLQQKHIHLSKNLHYFLDDICWLVQTLHEQATHLHELVPEAIPYLIGATDACAKGMDGVVYLYHGTYYIPYIWQTSFDPAISFQVVSCDNPAGQLTNFDFELAATISHIDVLSQAAAIMG